LRKDLQMVTWVEVLQGGAAIATAVYGYVRLSHKRRAEVKTIAYRWGSYIGCAVVGGASAIEIYKFGVSAELLTRKDVLWLLLNIWNGVAYLGCGIALAAVWSKQGKSKEPNPDGD
jgi:hypothetical protein